MDIKRKYRKDKDMNEDLYQYEMGIDLGADLENKKEKHKEIYKKNHSVYNDKNKK